MDRWFGKVAAVTGASEGIGEGIVRRLVEKGMKVVALARRQHLLDDLNREISAKHPGKCWVHTCDVSDELQVKNAFAWIQKEVGPVSVLVNNAAVCKMFPLVEMDIPLFKSTFDINLMGVMYCTKQGLASMKAAGISDGHIININSVAGHRDIKMTGLSAYSAGKHALAFLTTSLKRELAEAKSKIRVTSISPGYVITSMSAFFTKHIHHAPGLIVDDVADAVEYALSAPSHVNISEVILEPTEFDEKALKEELNKIK